MEKFYRILKVMYLKRLYRRLSSVTAEVYTTVFNRKELAMENIAEVIATNHEAAHNVFLGFIGQPNGYDADLMYYTKTIDRTTNSTRNFIIAQNFVYRLGFTLSAVETGESLKVMLSPRPRAVRVPNDSGAGS
jgi:hypothetical protein